MMILLTLPHSAADAADDAADAVDDDDVDAAAEYDNHDDDVEIDDEERHRGDCAGCRCRAM
jgi:hypothetical protein